MISKYRWEIALIIVGIVLTIIARDYAVTRRLSMGYPPSWGGEFLIIPLITTMYAAIKSDWSVEE